jgi:hypothetical protein
MEYVSALVPPVVMAALFIGVIVTMVKSQGGANKAKEDAAVDAALATRGEDPNPAARTAATAGAATAEGAKGDTQG